MSRQLQQRRGCAVLFVPSIRNAIYLYILSIVQVTKIVQAGTFAILVF